MVERLGMTPGVAQQLSEVGAQHDVGVVAGERRLEGGDEVLLFR